MKQMKSCGRDRRVRTHLIVARGLGRREGEASVDIATHVSEVEVLLVVVGLHLVQADPVARVHLATEQLTRYLDRIAALVQRSLQLQLRTWNTMHTIVSHNL
jgi:hypothetical protein